MSCAGVQYLCSVRLIASRCGGRPLSRKPGVISSTSSFDLERALALVGLVQEVGERRRVALGPSRLRGAERRERLRRDPPGLIVEPKLVRPAQQQMKKARWEPPGL